MNVSPSERERLKELVEKIAAKYEQLHALPMDGDGVSEQKDIISGEIGRFKQTFASIAEPDAIRTLIADLEAAERRQDELEAENKKVHALAMQSHSEWLLMMRAKDSLKWDAESIAERYAKWFNNDDLLSRAERERDALREAARWIPCDAPGRTPMCGDYVFGIERGTGDIHPMEVDVEDFFEFENGRYSHFFVAPELPSKDGK